ncbi:hypothetical protein [Anaeromyxobacter oryzae]|uniref:Uncharacterized protein n=1 Tax=Anaeromyxobacter oryzae TaxID=2918170 RepID=A0ABM7X0L3_9BACT|nr:hypothetical protein [Anaeromyxobacter oryzae]BDG05347.1 hypothetical protein AMOR_43430 [Anaeromyxobacter oryzae]
MKPAETKPATERIAPRPRTLEDLGVPGPLAAELEAVFRAMGSVHAGQIDGRAFVTRDGERHAIQVPAPKRAA